MQAISRKINRNKTSQLFLLMACLFLAFCTLGFSPPKLPAGKYRLDFFTSHNQFYVCDSAFSTNTGAADFWTTEAYEARLATGFDIAGIGTASYGHIKAELEVRDTPDTETNFGQYDHVAEGGFTIQSGILQVLNFPDYKSCLKLIVTPGKYRIRVYSSGLKNNNTEADEGTDHYRIVLWPGSNMECKALKQLIN